MMPETRAFRHYAEYLMLTFKITFIIRILNVSSYWVNFIAFLICDQ